MEVENPKSCPENSFILVCLNLGRVILGNCSGDVDCSRSMGKDVDTVLEDIDVNVFMIQHEKKYGLQR